MGAHASRGAGLCGRGQKGDVDARATWRRGERALAAISPDPAETNGRGYDYGPGLGLTLRAAVGAWPWEYVSLELESTWISTLEGSPNDHLIHEGRLHADVPVFRGLGLGGSLLLFRRDTLIPHEKTDIQQTPRFLLFVSWH